MSGDFKKVRTLSKSAITRIRNSLNQAITKGSLSKTIDSRYGVFRLAWEEVQKCHEKYVSSMEGEDLDEAWINELSELFDETEMEADNYLSELEHQKLMEEKDELKLKLEEEKRRESR